MSRSSPSSQYNAKTKWQTAAAANVEKKEDLGIDRSKSLFVVHMRALLNKRLLTFKRDKKMWAFVVAMPALFVLSGVLILLSVSSTNEPALVLTPEVSVNGIKCCL